MTAKPIYIVLGIWFCLAVSFGFFELARQLPFWGPPLIPIFLTFVFTSVFVKVGRLREVSLALQMDWLVYVAFLRLLALYTFILFVVGEFPGSFSIPATLGVVAVAATAALLIKYGRPLETKGRKWLNIWNVFAFCQLLSVIFLVAGQILTGYGAAFRRFASLPLNLFPTFIVPVSMTVHLLIMYRLRAGVGKIDRENV